MRRRLSRPEKFIRLSLLGLAIAGASHGHAQQTDPDVADSSTVVYEAEFFTQYSPVSVNDMIDRIPGISLALGNGSNGGRNSRGLGSGEGEILINGQRTTGKNNEGRSQLSRIAADQVDYIEIIRGTSDDMDIRGGGQVVNVVLLDAESRSSISTEINMDRLHDGTLDPGAKLSYAGQTGAFNYLFHIEAEPRYNNRFTNESSVNPEGELLETRFQENIRNQTEYETSFNLGYRFQKSMVQFNGLYAESNPPTDISRVINDYSTGSLITTIEREDEQRNRSNWEIGGDYEYSFNNGSKYRFLFIANDLDFTYTRDRFDVFAESETKDLFLFSAGRDRERIARTSYTFDLGSNQGMEFGIEGAQTIRDSDLRLGLSGTGITSEAHGGLVPQTISNASSTVEEIRFENFVIHNWQINKAMSLESSLIYETSTISQSGDVRNERDFSFLRPKIDYRFNITQSLQLRAKIEKTVSQLSFSDFSATSDSSDDDQNTQAGNPNIAQEQAWNYEMNLEFRLPNSIGVLNTELYYRDLTDVIDRIDISPNATDLQSARGNIGAGKRYGANFDASTRLGYLGVPDALLTLRFSVQDSKVTDPFLGTARRLRWNGRWFGRINLRHDITKYNFSYGFRYFTSAREGSGLTQTDIIDQETEIRDYGISLFAEKQAFNGITFRFDIQNANDQLRCRERIRFIGATAAGILEEVEDSCNGSGVKYALKIRQTF
ncbi:MAG: TonB-dependent receptor plug domain-containing protein [Gammaproteobacteria bacterium]|nr:TonB-dependent receptor plug domain-containing protein [Gammaproteobacteria bacterium]